MDAHKYRIGQFVAYRTPGMDAPRGDYVTIARLPQRDDGDFEYRMSFTNECDGPMANGCGTLPGPRE